MKQNILLSIGTDKNKRALLPSVRSIPKDKFSLYATDNTSKFLSQNKIDNELIYKVSDSNKQPNLANFLIKGTFDLIVNIPTHDTSKAIHSEFTDGQYIRRKAVENDVTLITDVEVAKLYLDSLATKNLLKHPNGKGESPETNPFTAYYHPIYDINKSYDFNYEFGPFFYGVYPPTINGAKKSFLGFKVNSLFGVPAGPLLNSNWVETYAKLGFDILTYKTIRTINKACWQPPNIVYIDSQQDYNYDFKKPAYSSNNGVIPYNQISITNSFGVPSKEPDVWQEDVERLLPKLDKGQLLIVSVMGTTQEGMTEKEFINDFIKAALLAQETGVKAVEINLSCPNLGAGAICNDIAISKQISKAVKEALGNTPLLAKLGYFKETKQLHQLIKETNEFIDCYVAINTVPKRVFNNNGGQALPGRSRLISGTCGAVIKDAGLTTVKILDKLRRKHQYAYRIIGVGGVMTPEDYFAYLKAGADAVQSATGAMWNPYLAYQIRKAHDKNGKKRTRKRGYSRKRKISNKKK